MSIIFHARRASEQFRPGLCCRRTNFREWNPPVSTNRRPVSNCCHRGVTKLCQKPHRHALPFRPILRGPTVLEKCHPRARRWGLLTILLRSTEKNGNNTFLK
ncbi:hypothetical protein CEXT_425121 [Caerostris extrusa]|uniref:Uncharacterized protein n=1 Tax=Caerostris extrusa TaxID=172846 RepID=A0AAV4RK45_CAEEX|nr:hypothetical protein CEXT_425121 [Caerostris extrusa]